MTSTKRKRSETLRAQSGAGDDGVQQFRKLLQELRTKSQSKIGNLTTLAENQHAMAREVVQVLAEEIQEAQVSRVQPLISVVDSIMKKIGRDYKLLLSDRIPAIIRCAAVKSDSSVRGWLQRMVNESWRRHELLPVPVLDVLDGIFASHELFVATSVTAPTTTAAPPPASGAMPAAAVVVVDADAEPTPAAVAAPRRPPTSAPPTATLAPPAKGVPVALPRSTPVAAAPAAPAGLPAATAKGVSAAVPVPAAAAVTAPAAAGRGASVAPASQASPQAQQAETPALVERRLTILTKIIDRKSPAQEELQEIMQVPEIKKAIAMQQKGNRADAMALLSEFKRELERKRTAHSEMPVDPRQQARPADPRSAESRPADPRQQQVDSTQQPEVARPTDPRQPDSRPADPRQIDRRQPVAERQRRADPRQRVPEMASPVPAADGEESQPVEIVSDDEVGPTNGQSAAQVRQVLQGLPSIGFSEAWLRQFIEQMPGRLGQQEQDAPPQEAPCVGRKVLSAEGEQMVYVDELAPSEVLLLMQLIFLLEERIRSTGGGLDLAQRIPHTFSYLQVEPAIDVMLKRFFDELPYQCTTTGLRFSSRERLRKHHDSLYRRRTLQQQRQRGAEARGWMDSIPEWVGNRDLVVGPALFRLGGASDDVTKPVQEALHEPQSDEEDTDVDPFGRWAVPYDVRRSVCPISGEALEKTWSTTLNDWACKDVVVVELGADKPVRFPPGGPIGPHGLSETSVIFKKSCFFNTLPEKRLQALEECRSTHCLLKTNGATGGAPEPKKTTKSEEPELQALAAFRRPAAKFF